MCKISLRQGKKFNYQFYIFLAFSDGLKFKFCGKNSENFSSIEIISGRQCIE